MGNEPGWTIPDDDVVDGFMVCLKNARRLSQDAKLMFNNNRYSTCIHLAVLALEELGKTYMLLLAASKNQVITERTWNKEFRVHQQKLATVVECLETFSENDSAKAKQMREKLKIFLNEISRLKMEAMYVDWDSTKKQWRYFDEQKGDKQRLAKEVLRANAALIDPLIRGLESDGDFIWLPIKEKIKLILQHKASAFCHSCGEVMIAPVDIRRHDMLYPHHKNLTWSRIITYTAE